MSPNVAECRRMATMREHGNGNDHGSDYGNGSGDGYGAGHWNGFSTGSGKGFGSGSGLGYGDGTGHGDNIIWMDNTKNYGRDGDDEGAK